jgi:hypothetical protein
MRVLCAFVCALVISATTRAQSSAEVEAWQKRFPSVSISDSFALRQMASEFERQVGQARKENVASVARNLYVAAQRELEAAKEIERRGGLSTKEAKEKIAWIVGRFYPYLRVITGPLL